jgi:hypothetical protein
MSVKTIRKKLHQFVDTMEDKKAIAMYNFLEQEMNTDALRKKLIFAERDKVMAGEAKMYTWAEVKKMAKNKRLRNVI